MSACRDCGRPVRWVETREGRRLPLDPASNPRGDVRLDGRRGVVLAGREADVARRMHEPLYLRHAATCPRTPRPAAAAGFRIPAGLMTEPSPPPPVRPAPPPAPRPRNLYVDVWCDGSCPAPMGPGGWAAILRLCDIDERMILAEREIAGYECEATNQVMELMAAAEALYAIEKRSHVVITSDSKYLVDGMNKRWYLRWRRNGWLNSKGDPVVNRSLWEALIAAVEYHHVQWRWVKGHAKGAHPLNERADFLAGEQTAIAQAVLVDARIRPILDDLDAGFDLALAKEAA